MHAVIRCSAPAAPMLLWLAGLYRTGELAYPCWPHFVLVTPSGEAVRWPAIPNAMRDAVS